MDDSKTKLLEKIKASNAILVTVSKDPTVDQLAACISFALLVNKLNKTGSALYSGQTPSTIEFLKPEQTLEKNTDSLQDFIISLDKNKADKLRTKVDDQSVKIFITPYKTSLSENDLEFSQGDFNVDLIIALGVYSKEELDLAITSHGGILHDATIATVTINDPSELGSINLNDSNSSSFCELIASLAKNLGNNLIDQQIATALLTGIVAETDRFSNDKTTPQTMSVSSELMNAGANPKLIASELGSSSSVSSINSASSDSDSESSSAETLNIDHDLDELLGKDEEGEDKNIELPELSSDSSPGENQANGLSSDSNPNSNVPENETTKETTDPVLNKFPDQTPNADILNKELDGSEDTSTKSPSNQNLQEGSLPSFVPPTDDQANQTIKPLDSYNATNPTLLSDSDTKVDGSNQDQSSPSSQDQTFTPPPPGWQAPSSPTQDQSYPAISTNHSNSPMSGDQPNPMVEDARNSVENALESMDEMPSGAPPSPPVGEVVQPGQATDLASDVSSDSQNDNNAAENLGGNQTGLDPSLFAEPEKQNSDNSKAPPVPPPVVQLPFNNNDQSNPNR